eukprot:SAG22_NODE_1913_length_3322_cov_2.699969_4_plen_81_part_00
MRVPGEPVRDVRAFDEFPALRVDTHYGSIVLPAAELFKFSDIELNSKKSPLEYESLRAINLRLTSDEATVRLTGPQVRPD